MKRKETTTIGAAFGRAPQGRFAPLWLWLLFPVFVLIFLWLSSDFCNYCIRQYGLLWIFGNYCIRKYGLLWMRRAPPTSSRNI